MSWRGASGTGDGYGVHRTLTKLGEDCMVVAPSMIPRVGLPKTTGKVLVRAFAAV
jgi:hypothetical protein